MWRSAHATDIKVLHTSRASEFCTYHGHQGSAHVTDIRCLHMSLTLEPCTCHGCQSSTHVTDIRALHTAIMDLRVLHTSWMSEICTCHGHRSPTHATDIRVLHTSRTLEFLWFHISALVGLPALCHPLSAILLLRVACRTLTPVTCAELEHL